MSQLLKNKRVEKKYYYSFGVLKVKSSESKDAKIKKNICRINKLRFLLMKFENFGLIF